MTKDKIPPVGTLLKTNVVSLLGKFVWVAPGVRIFPHSIFFTGRSSHGITWDDHGDTFDVYYLECLIVTVNGVILCEMIDIKQLELVE